LILPLVASLLIALACGTLLALALAPSLKASRAGLVLALFLGGGLGLGILSGLHFLTLLTDTARWLPAFDLAACALSGGICLFRRRGPGGGKDRPPTSKTGAWSRWQLALAGVLSLQAAAAAATFLFAFFKEPHGRWDAWLIWNMHARFLFRGGERWREAFASGQDWSHWDYPLLLPLSIARGWIYQGGEGLAAPALIAFVFTGLTIGLLGAALTLLRGRTAGCLAAMALIGTPFFLFMGAAQFADIPLAFFFLATFVALAAISRYPENRGGLLILAGLAAGLAAWTKNEGLLFALAATASLFGVTGLREGGKAACRRTFPFLAGALPILAVVLYFKLTLAPPNDIVAGAGIAALPEKLLDPDRYRQIARAFVLTGLSFTQGIVDVGRGMRLNPGPVSILLLGVYLLLAGIRIPREERSGLLAAAATLGLMLAGYFGIYVITSQDLYWHLATSLNRLFLQLWPGLILLCFLSAATAEQAPSPAGDRDAPSPSPAPRSPQGKYPQKNREAK
jgi:hypothetical protein